MRPQNIINMFLFLQHKKNYMHAQTDTYGMTDFWNIRNKFNFIFLDISKALISFFGV